MTIYQAQQKLFDKIGGEKEILSMSIIETPTPIILVRTQKAIKEIPQEFEGFSVKIEIDGGIKAL